MKIWYHNPACDCQAIQTSLHRKKRKVSGLSCPRLGESCFKPFLYDFKTDFLLFINFNKQVLFAKSKVN